MSATLTDLVRPTGMNRPAERVRWLLVTWDLAVDRGSANKYYRFFLTDDCLLITNGARSEKVFADGKPLRGRMAFSRFNDAQALNDALTTTASKLSGEYAMVCRPLAVDCSDWDGEFTRAWKKISDAGHLVHELFNKTPTGIELLSHINNTRGLAMKTHLHPDWQGSFSHSDPRGLWAGL